MGIIITLIIVSLASGWFWLQSRNKSVLLVQETTGSVLVVDQQSFDIEIAETPAQLQLGLSGRDEIGSDGLLFIFSGPNQSGFWMKDMKFALDMVWIANGEIVEITRDVPFPTSPEENTDAALPRYYPSQPIEMVLEVTAGFAQQHDWQVGDSVSLIR